MFNAVNGIKHSGHEALCGDGRECSGVFHPHLKWGCIIS